MSNFDAEQFRQAMAQLPEIPHSEHDQPPYWEHWQGILRDWILDESNDPAYFMKCPAVYHTMLTNHWIDAMDHESASLPEEMRKLALMPELGYDYMKDGGRSRNLVHQLYHLHRW